MEKIQLGAIKLVGLTTRTNNKNEWQTEDRKILPLVHRYFQEKLYDKIPNRRNPLRTFSVFTDYESDHTGEYTYLMGEEVTNFEDIPEGFETLTIPPQLYVKFTEGPGPCATINKKAWEKIWKMSEEDLGGVRSYQTDFEIYDERANDHENMVFDIYLGLKA